MNEQKILTGKGITVAVLDTGIFPHIDFDNRMSAESSAEAGEHPAGSTGVRHRNADFW